MYVELLFGLCYSPKDDKTNQTKTQCMRRVYSQRPINFSNCLHLYWDFIPCSDFLETGNLDYKDLMHKYKIIFHNLTPVTWHCNHIKDKMLPTTNFLATLKMSVCSPLSSPFTEMIPPSDV